MSHRPGFGAWARPVWIASLAVLLVSGFGQMPIFKRYYVADVPGLGWTADFFLTHKLHYLAATVLVFVAFCALGRYLTQLRRHWRPTGLGWARAVVLALLAATGAVRVVKNLPGGHFSPELTMAVDWSHLGLALVFTVLALAAWAARRPYLRPGMPASPTRRPGSSPRPRA